MMSFEQTMAKAEKAHCITAQQQQIHGKSIVGELKQKRLEFEKPRQATLSTA